VVSPWRRMVQIATYRGQEGQWAWLLHRLAGLGVVLFVGLHVFDIWLIGLGRETFQRFLFLYGSPPAKFLEVLLAFGVLYHALNGVRIVLVDFVPAVARRQSLLARAEIVVLVLVLLPVAWVTLRGLF
jgi:succinate dehydrogenase / fumarate reductase cytochrome b subunit